MLRKQAFSPEKYDKNIAVSPANNICRGIHPRQNLAAEHADRRCHDPGKANVKPHAVSHIFTQGMVVPRPKLLGYWDRKAIAYPHAEPNHHKVDGACRPYCRKGIYP